MFDDKILQELKEKINNLDKKNTNLIICDFDDTLFSTKGLIENNYRKGRRGNEGNEYIIKNNLIDKIIENEYKNKTYPTTISSKLRKNHDLILTVGIKEFQEKKAKATNLDHINMIVTNTAKEKIIATIKYIANNLKFIPSKITIYEDRIEYFIEYKEFLEQFIGTNIELMLTEMQDNKQNPKISKI